MQSHIIINTELNLIISDFSYSPELNLFNEPKEIEYDRARIKIDIKAIVISYVDFTLAPTLYGGHSGYFIATPRRSTPKPNVSKASAKVQTDQHLGSYNSSLRSLQLCN